MSPQGQADPKCQLPTASATGTAPHPRASIFVCSLYADPCGSDLLKTDALPGPARTLTIISYTCCERPLAQITSIEHRPSTNIDPGAQTTHPLASRPLPLVCPPASASVGPSLVPPPSSEIQPRHPLHTPQSPCRACSNASHPKPSLEPPPRDPSCSPASRTITDL